MCDLDDYGVPEILHAADTVECRCQRDPVMTEEQTGKSFARMYFPSPDIRNAAELQDAYVIGWMARAKRDGMHD